MDLTLSWDLFIIVFFALVIAYSFIIGKHESVKIIIATYIAIVAVQGIANIIERLTGETEPILMVLGLNIDIAAMTAIKLTIFVSIIIFIAIRGGIEVDYNKEPGSSMNLLLTGLFGTATAGLLLATLLTFVLDVPLLSGAVQDSAQLSAVLKQSKLMQLMIWNLDLWFSLPALLILTVGFVSSETSGDD